jgi:serine/threonine protein kinase
MLHYHRQLHKDLYNAAVSNRITSYKKFGKSVSYLEQQNCLPDFKEVRIEYKEINSQALQATLKRVDFAFGRFFKGLAKYPRFKSPRHYSGWTYPSFTGWKVHSTGDNGYLELSKIGQIQMRGKARLWGHPKALDIVNRNGKWYASIVLEIDDTLLKNSRKTDNGVIAIDLGCNDAIAWTNGSENVLAAEAGTRTVVGTYGYMPQEQFGGRTVPASDLYSLGCTIIYLVTGTHPADLPQKDFRIQFQQVANLSPSFANWLQIFFPKPIKKIPHLTAGDF